MLSINEVTEILNKNLAPAIYRKVSFGEWNIGNEKFIKIIIATSDTKYDAVRLPECISLVIEPKAMFFQCFGGNGGQNFYIACDDPIINYSRVKIPFRTPAVSKTGFTNCLTNICKNYMQALRDNRTNLINGATAAFLD